MRVLWISGASGISGKMRNYLSGYFNAANVPLGSVFYLPMPFKINNDFILQTKNKKKTVNPTIKAATRKIVQEMVNRIKPDLIIIGSPEALAAIADQTSLDLCRGSVYQFDNIPALVIASLAQLHTKNTAPWLFIQDLQKGMRWVNNEQRQQPKFVYKVCKTRADIDEAREFLNSCFFISSDIETTRATYITCIGYTGLRKDGTLLTYIIPFINPIKPFGCQWAKEADEIYAWEAVREINQNDAYIIFQNGSYDNAFFVRYNIAPRRFLVDTYHLLHSLWPESPKKLNFISSVFLDFCRYWKDEIKGSADQRQVKKDAVPDTANGLEYYWRYCGLDCYSTLLNAKCMLRMYKNSDWYQHNYNVEFTTQFGPNFAMTMRGMLLSDPALKTHELRLNQEIIKAEKRLAILVADENFNANSPDQVAQLLYGVFGATVPKVTGARKTEARPTGEPALLLVKEQHPLYAIYINAIFDVKKPMNNKSKYIMNKKGYKKRLTHKGRFKFSLNCGSTVTWRCAGADDAFWIGTNPQNVPEEIRNIIIADLGYFIYDADYEQSDAVFVAFESGDENYIRNVLSDKDTHCLHGAFFFGEDYEEFYGQYKSGNVAYTDKVHGHRAITKHIVHGANYIMQAYTLYVQLRREGILPAATKLEDLAKQVSHKPPYQWGVNECVKFCNIMLELYHKMYPDLRGKFYPDLNNKLKKDHALVNAFGMHRTFFGHVTDELNSKTLRDGAGFIGQSDTASNVNRALRLNHYGFDPAIEKRESDLFDPNCPIEESFEELGGIQHLQVHDSLVGQVPQNKLWLRDKLLTNMEQPVTIRDRTFHVPASATIGCIWGESMIPWTAKITAEEIMDRTRT